MTLRDRCGIGSSIPHQLEPQRSSGPSPEVCPDSAASLLLLSILPALGVNQLRQGLSFPSPSSCFFHLAFREPPHLEEDFPIYPILALSELPEKAEHHRGPFLKHPAPEALGRGNTNLPSVAIQHSPAALHQGPVTANERQSSSPP